MKDIKDYNIDEYKDIEGYEGHYAITIDGRVWSYKRNRFLKPTPDKDGYYVVSLSKNNKQKKCKIHRLVGKAFIPNPDNLPQINHKDEIRNNNHVDNLEWCDAKYNNNYGNRIAKHAKAVSKPVYCVELDKVFPSIKEAAAAINVAPSTVGYTVNGRQKTAVGYHFRWATIDDHASSLNKKLDYLIDMIEADRLALGREAALNAQYRAIEKKIAEAI